MNRPLQAMCITQVDVDAREIADSHVVVAVRLVALEIVAEAAVDQVANK